VRVQVELLGTPISVREARQLVRRTLAEWNLLHLEDSATLLVSEVVTNAVLHARTGLALSLCVADDVLRVTVSDGSPRRPQRRPHSLEAGTGRGLSLLAALSTEWGSGPGEDPWQKDVWFELPVDPDAVPDPQDDGLGPIPGSA
jgi:anti-sigma regulatory factor (Ser/Thr protein kinase)